MYYFRKRIVLVSYTLLGIFLYELFYPTAAYALTGGPSQPEVQSFTPVGVSDMVDIFSGDFKYNIPLLEVDGYPVNISYSGGINIDQEASWVGLGWNLNPGAVDRNMRGLPDEFDGDVIEKEVGMKPNWNLGLAVGKDWEIFGNSKKTKIAGASAKYGLNYNSYTGLGLDVSFGLNSKGSVAQNLAPAFGAGLSIGYTGESGLNIQPNLNMSVGIGKTQNEDNNQGLKLSTSAAYNSRSGLKALNFGWSGYANRTVSKTKTVDKKEVTKSGNRSASLGGSGSIIDIGGQSWTPSIATPMKNFSLAMSVAFGKEFVGATRNYSFPVNFSIQQVANNEIKKAAYGYMNHQNAGSGDLLDVNREKDQAFSEDHHNLYVPVQTPDVFSVSAQGIGGSFRVYRNDQLNFFEEENAEESNDIGLGFDIGTLKTFKGGLNFSYNHTQTESGNWLTNNHLQNNYHAMSKANFPNNPEYEAYYFKQMGEPIVSNIERNRSLEGYNLIIPNVQLDEVKGTYIVNSSKNDPLASKRFSSRVNPLSSGGTADYANTDNVQKERQPRNLVMNAIRADKGYNGALTRGIEVFSINSENVYFNRIYPDYLISRKSAIRKSHHITEMNVYGTDGQRFVFGLPAYNLTQTEVTFAVNGGSANCATGLVPYSSTDLDYRYNDKGVDNYVSKTVTPGYPYSFLLTAILSSDYVDLTNNGVTDDDLGTATKFNYSKTNSNYKWRVPFESGMANYQQGNITDDSDDKGSIVYGEKEIYYLRSIEGKNHVALFYISIRKDAFGVGGIEGGINYNSAQYRLDSIILYNKQDYIQNGTSAYKIKGVHLTYDYSLVGDVKNFNTYVYGSDPVKGKLTLKSIYFTYGTSFKGKLSPYQFSYNQEGASGYKYHLKGADRWGTYTDPGTGVCGNNGSLNSVEFPFTDQNSANLDDYAAAWSLSEITLPSGGKITVEYEADDYSYVQNKKAMTMYKIQGFGSNSNFSERNGELFKVGSSVSNYIFIDLGGVTTQQELDDIVRNISELQVTLFADINGKSQREYVKGYVDFISSNSLNYGLCNSGNSAWIKVELVPMRDRGGIMVNPMSKLIWNFAKVNTPGMVYNTKVKSKNNFAQKSTKFLYEIVGMFNEVVNMALGINNNLRLRGFGRKVTPQKSWIRLNARKGIKIGGGHRVKSVKISDNWAVMGSMNTSAPTAEYGQEYDYSTTEIGSDGVERTISSGVAAYEPAIGGDENPFHMPKYVIHENKWALDSRFMDDVPYGETFMPGASVGYSKVVVKNLDHAGVTRTATGKQEYQFFTAKDFPTKISDSELSVKIIKPNFAEQLFNLDRRTEIKAAAGQGYLIELNDMHGKAKAEYTYSNESNEPIGGIEYSYLRNSGTPNELSNSVQVVGADGSIETKEISTEVEVYNDFRRAVTDIQNAGVDFNIDFFNISILPFLIPSLYNSYSSDHRHIQSAVTVKIVNRYGIVNKTTAIKEGSRIETENLLYDELTGDVLVSSVQNEFNDNIYSSKTPAHWAYDRMGPAYKNIDIVLDNVKLEKDSIILPNGLLARDYLVPGDVVYVQGNGFPPLIGQVYEGKGSKLNIIDIHNGASQVTNINKTVQVTVIRSGRKNLQNVTIEQASSHHYSTAGNLLSLDSIISTSAVEFDEYWPFYCDKTLDLVCDTIETINLSNFETFLNDLITYKGLIRNGSQFNYFTNECLSDYLVELGYTNDNDTIYKYDSYSLSYIPIDGTECFKCTEESLFVSNANKTTFMPISQLQWARCATSCIDPDGTYYAAVEMPDNDFFHDLRNIVLENNGSCDTTSLYVNIHNNMSSHDDDGTGITIDYGMCEYNCQLHIDIPTDYCFDSLFNFTNLVYADESTISVDIVTRLLDGSLDTSTVSITSSCPIELYEIDCHNECVTPTTSTKMNPYKYGILGNWRMKRNLAYVGERNYSNQTRTRTDGTYKTYDPYYTYSAGSMTKSSSSKWVWASEVTKYTPFGNEIENKDALDRYSAAVFGFNYTLPTAVAGNAKHKQIAYSGFEENDLFWNKANCFAYHFKEDPFTVTQGEYSDQYSHSGNYSLKVNSSQTITANIELSTCEDLNLLDSFQAIWQKTNCVGVFNPDTGRYILSAWIKQGESFTDTSYLDAEIQVKLHKTGAIITTSNLIADGPIIDGWQRVFAEFHIDPTVEKVEFVFVAPSGEAAWFDDFRVHPFNSNMKTYAYDQITLRLMAELDDNNFATYYEYDKEGALIRVKKETVKGVKTLKEIRKQIVKTTP